jgi:hypothetical protein
MEMEAMADLLERPDLLERLQQNRTWGRRQQKWEVVDIGTWHF